MACMCLTYLLGTVVSGLLMGASFEANVGSLLLAILGKMVMSLGWASLYTFLNVVFRRYFGISVALSFFFGTGILIIGMAAVLGSSPLLNLFLCVSEQQYRDPADLHRGFGGLGGHL